MSKNLLLIGATGLIGKYILKAIVSSKSNFDRIAILTSPSTVTNKATEIQSLKDQGVEIIIGDVTSEQDVKKAYEGIDTVISAVGRNVIAGQVELIKWADSTPNVKRFFPSEYGTDVEYSATTSPHEKPHQQKLKVRAFIKAEVKNLEITYLVTGPYSELFFGAPGSGWTDAGGFDVKAKKAVLLGDGKGPVSFTSMADVGNLLVAALLHPEAAKNKALCVNSFSATPDEILAEFEKQTGGQKWDVSYTSLEDLKKSEEKMWADGSPLATGYTLRRIWTEGGTLYEKRDNGIIGEPKMETLEDQVRLAIEAQTKS